MKLSEMLSRSLTNDTIKPRKHIPWISGPIDRKAVKANHGTHEETKMNTDQNVIEFDETRLHHADADAPIFKHRHEASPIDLFYDLFFVANLATFTANHEIDTGETLGSYVGFFTLMWFTWLQTSLYDVRFSTDSHYQRACNLISFGVFTGFAIVGPIFDTGKAYQDVKAFKAMSLILMISRLALMVQYSVVLWYVRGYKKVFVPLLLHILTLAVSAVVFLGLAFSFKYEKDDTGAFLYKEGQKITIPSNSYAGWYVIVILEAIAVFAISSLWRVVSFKHTHLVERVGLLTLIVIGEGVIGMTKSVTYVAKYSAITSGTTIGVVAAAVSLIYLLFALYHDQIEHDRFGSIRQQIWAMLHYPLHVAIVLTVEGSTMFITWWIATENLKYLDTNFTYDITYNSNNTILFVNGLEETLAFFEAGFKKQRLPDFSNNITQIQALDITMPEDHDKALTIAFDMYKALSSWIFETFGFKLSQSLLSKVSKDNLDKALAIGQAFSTIFLFFLLSVGCVLITLGIMYWFGKNHKSRGEMASIFVRIFAGIGLALVSTSYYTGTYWNLMSSPMVIPLVVIVYLLVIIVDNILIWHANKTLAKHSTLAQVDEA